MRRLILVGMDSKALISCITGRRGELLELHGLHLPGSFSNLNELVSCDGFERLDDPGGPVDLNVRCCRGAKAEV